MAKAKRDRDYPEWTTPQLLQLQKDLGATISSSVNVLWQQIVNSALEEGESVLEDSPNSISDFIGREQFLGVRQHLRKAKNWMQVQLEQVTNEITQRIQGNEN